MGQTEQITRWLQGHNTVLAICARQITHAALITSGEASGAVVAAVSGVTGRRLRGETGVDGRRGLVVS